MQQQEQQLAGNMGCIGRCTTCRNRSGDDQAIRSKAHAHIIPNLRPSPQKWKHPTTCRIGQMTNHSGQLTLQWKKLQSDSDLQRLLSCYHCSYLSQRRLSTFPLLSFIVCYYFVSCSLFGKFSNGICVLNTTDRYHGCVLCLIVLDWWTPQTIAWLLSICHWHIISDRFSLFVQQIKSTRLTPPWQIRPLQRVT